MSNQSVEAKTVHVDAGQAETSVAVVWSSAKQTSTVTSRWVTVWLAGLFLLCFGYFRPHSDPNQTARIDMAVAIVDHATFAIDSNGVVNTSDSDFYQGRYYSNKAPGSSFIAVPMYLLYKGVLALRGGIPADPANDPELGYLEAFTLVAVPATLWLLLFFWFLACFSSSIVNRAVLTIALGLGTMIFPYAQNYFSHVTVAGVLFTALVLIYLSGGRDAARGRLARWLTDNPARGALLAGLALGTAVLFEYPTAVIAVILAIYAVVRLPRKALPYIVLGAAPPLLMLMAYNFSVYHNPFTLSYASGSDVSNGKHLSQGFAGFKLPYLASWWGMSGSPYRGLFFLSPFLVLSFPGYALWRRRGGREWLVCLAIPVAFFLTISTYIDWSGGFAVGPRYLIPMLPFLAFPIIFTLDAIATARIPPDVSGLVYGLVCVLMFDSLINVWGETISLSAIFWPNVSNQNPLFSQDLPSLFQGFVIPNQGTKAFGLSGMASLALLLGLLAAWSGGVWSLFQLLRRFNRRPQGQVRPE